MKGGGSVAQLFMKYKKRHKSRHKAVYDVHLWYNEYRKSLAQR